MTEHLISSQPKSNNTFTEEGSPQVEQADTIHEEMGNVSAIMALSGKPLLSLLNQITYHYQHGKRNQTLSIASDPYSVHPPTNTTPHERLFNYNRKSTTGNSMPSWLSEPGPILIKKHVRKSKYEPIVEEADLLEANPEYAFVRLKSGHETTVSLRDIAPHPKSGNRNQIRVDMSNESIPETRDDVNESIPETCDVANESIPETCDVANESIPEIHDIRCSNRVRRIPERFADFEMF